MAKKKTVRTSKKKTASKAARAKGGAAKATSAKSGKDNSARRPSWSIVTYEQIEEWRKKQGLPKKRMASLLGVTNSTYHNWARGIAVATYNTQRKIRDVLDRDAVPAGIAGPGRRKSGPNANPVQAHGGARLEELTVDLVKTYVEANPGKITPDALIELLDRVRAKLAR